MEVTKNLVRISAVLMVFGLSATAGLPEPGKWSIGEVKLKALVDTNFSWNFKGTPNSTNLPLAAQNNFRYNDRGDRQFVLNQGQIAFSHSADPIGFDAAFWFGTQADTAGIVDGSVDRGMAVMRKAVVNYKSGSWGLDVGKFDSGFGFETYDSIDNWNYGRSLLFTKINPGFFNGARFNWASGGMWNLSVVAANSSTRHYDNNRGKTAALQFNWWNNQGCSLNLSGAYGAEGANDNGNQRKNLTLTYKHLFNNGSGVALDGGYAQGKNEFLNATTTGVASRWGTALYGMYSFYDQSKTALRYEYVSDKQGAVTLTNQKVTFNGVTLTHRKMVTKNFSVWAEGRYDKASKQVYVDSAGKAKASQVTATAAFTLNI